MKPIELNVLTALLFSDRELKLYAVNLFQEEDFITLRAKEIFKKIKKLYSSGIVNVSAESIFEQEELKILQTNAIKWESIEEISQTREILLAEKAKEQIIGTLSNINYLSFEELKNFYIKILIDIEKRGGNIQSKTIVSDWNIPYKELLTETELKGSIDGSDFYFGIPELDRNVILNRGHFVVIGARPNVGKTQFAMQFALYNIKKGFKILYVSTEMTARDFMKRILALYFNKSPKDINTLLKENQEEVKELINLLNEKLLLVIGQVNIADIKVMAKLHEVDIVIVDYLQMLKAPGQSEYERITNVSTELSSLAKEIDALVIATAQINREIKKGKTPSLEYLKGSGQIEQQADTVLLLHRPDLQIKAQGKEVSPLLENKLKVIVAKNRHKPFWGAIELNINKDSGKIESSLNIDVSEDENVDLDDLLDNIDDDIDGIDF